MGFSTFAVYKELICCKVLLLTNSQKILLKFSVAVRAQKSKTKERTNSPRTQVWENIHDLKNPLNYCKISDRKIFIREMWKSLSLLLSSVLSDTQ